VSSSRSTVEWWPLQRHTSVSLDHSIVQENGRSRYNLPDFDAYDKERSQYDNHIYSKRLQVRDRISIQTFPFVQVQFGAVVLRMIQRSRGFVCWVVIRSKVSFAKDVLRRDPLVGVKDEQLLQQLYGCMRTFAGAISAKSLLQSVDSTVNLANVKTFVLQKKPVCRHFLLRFLPYNVFPRFKMLETQAEAATMVKATKCSCQSDL
jgi:hypothetical protein